MVAEALASPCRENDEGGFLVGEKAMKDGFLGLTKAGIMSRVPSD